jgi:hypothetical protein
MRYSLSNPDYSLGVVEINLAPLEDANSNPLIHNFITICNPLNQQDPVRLSLTYRPSLAASNDDALQRESSKSVALVEDHRPTSHISNIPDGCLEI